LRELETPGSLTDADVRDRLHHASDRDLATFVLTRHPKDARVRTAAAAEALARRGGAHDAWMLGILHTLSKGEDPAAEVARKAIEGEPAPVR
jgi:hypothetical protein